jgi:hypothetical protein
MDKGLQSIQFDVAGYLLGKLVFFSQRQYRVITLHI